MLETWRNRNYLKKSSNSRTVLGRNALVDSDFLSEFTLVILSGLFSLSMYLQIEI